MSSEPNNTGTGGPTPDLDARLRAIENGAPRAGDGIGGLGADDARLLAAMRRDRAALRALAVEPAPAHLFDAALNAGLDAGSDGFDTFDADALRRLEDGVPDQPPVSRVVPEHWSLRGWLSRHPGQGFIAAAATLALLVAGGALLGRSPGPTPLEPAGPVASGSAASPRASEVEAGSEPRLAEAAPAVPGDAAVPGAGAQAALPAAGVRVASVFDGAALMTEGRLLVVARAGSAERLAPALAAMSARPLGDRSAFALAPGLPGDAMALLNLPDIAAPAFADSRETGVEVRLPRRSAWSGTVAANANGLASLLGALRDAGCDVEMRELPVAVRLESGPTASEVLWWSRPPTSWTRPAVVPVIVEALDERP